MILIAECCQNHNGDVALLKEMVWAAAEGGATHVKMQTISSDELTHRPRFDEGVTENGVTKVIKRPYAPERDRLAKLDLPESAFVEFIEECRKAKVEPLTTVFTRAKVKPMAELGWRSVKVASYDCASPPLLGELADHFDQIFVSTGATFDEEVKAAADLLRAKKKDFSLLHCVTIYPTPLNQLHLARMEWLRTLAPKVGFSDHTLTSRDGVWACLAAIAFGAEVIERHFTILPPDQSRDGPVSVRPEQLREIAEFARRSKEDQLGALREKFPDLAVLRGDAHRTLSHEELLNRDYYRGRFASKVGGNVVYNWETVPVDHT